MGPVGGGERPLRPRRPAMDASHNSHLIADNEDNRPGQVKTTKSGLGAYGQPPGARRLKRSPHIVSKGTGRRTLEPHTSPLNPCPASNSVKSLSLGIWLLGLVACFSLRVREVPGSIPGAALHATVRVLLPTGEANCARAAMSQAPQHPLRRAARRARTYCCRASRRERH